MTTSDDSRSEAKHLLKKLAFLAGPAVAQTHQWIWEADRWKELVFALLTQTSGLPQPTVRLLTDQLLQTDLLDVSELSSGLGAERALKSGDAHVRRMLETFLDAGMNDAQAHSSAQTVCEAAALLEKSFEGRLQVYLRRHAELILNDAIKNFGFSRLDQAASRYAITFWLQNIANMPLSLRDPSIDLFCQIHGTTAEALFAAADELGFNFAVVDDLVNEYLRAAEEQPAKGDAADLISSPSLASKRRRKLQGRIRKQGGKS